MDQGQTISEMKHALKIKEDENQRLEMDLQSNTRQLGMVKS